MILLLPATRRKEDLEKAVNVGIQEKKTNKSKIEKERKKTSLHHEIST